MIGTQIWRVRIGWVFTGILLLLILYGALKNLSHPLLWADEAETIVFAQSVLMNGYPNVFFGENIINMTEQEDKTIGIKDNGTYILSVWGQYYLGAVGVKLAKRVDDVYQKTLFLRLPFTLVGLAGVLLFPLGVIFNIRKERRVFFILVFLLMEVSSVFLMLHLRVARHYPIAIFVTSILIILFLGYRVFGKWRNYYVTLFPVVLILLFMTFWPQYFIFILSIIIFDVLDFLGRRHVYRERTKTFREYLRLNLPIFLSLFVTVPLMLYFEIFYVSGEIAKYFNVSSMVYIKNFFSSIIFLLLYDNLGVWIVLQILTLSILGSTDKYRIMLRSNKLKRASCYLIIFIGVYLVTISRMPVLFERYVHVLQPVLSLAIALDIFILVDVAGSDRKLIRGVLSAVIFVFLFMSIYKFRLWTDYYYELSNPYRGPVDYAIEYIKSNFPEPEILVIATNYEEQVYMYYLGSRVTVGYVGNNLEEDRKVQPDIIIPRRGRPNNVEVLAELLNKEEYELVTLPVFDYFYNNIPELGSHLYKTKLAENPDDRLRLFIRKELYEEIK